MSQISQATADTLADNANAAAMMLHVVLEDDFTFLEAFRELQEMDNDDEAIRFIPFGRYETCDMDTLYTSVERYADAIYEELKTAYEMGRADAQ